MLSKRLLSIVASLGLLFSGCIKDELPNIECDIEGVTVAPKAALKSQPDVKEKAVNIFIKKNTVNITKDLELIFKLSPGATMEPKNTKLDYSKPQPFKITSEDGKYSKSYIVNVLEVELPKKYSFEKWNLINDSYWNAYEEVYANNFQFEFNIWSSGNAGYEIIAGTNPPEFYPTRKTEAGYKGQGLCVETKLAAPVFKMPIAAGNMFIGSFDGTKAMKDPMGATRFGLPFEQEPERITFWYKYEPKWIETTATMDECDIYGVFFDNNGGTLTLDGANVLSHPNIVALARIQDHGATPMVTTDNGYVTKELIFDYKKTVDPDKLKNSGYSFSVVFSSSLRGAEFIGAPGSTLYIDEVEVFCKP